MLQGRDPSYLPIVLFVFLGHIVGIFGLFAPASTPPKEATRQKVVVQTVTLHPRAIGTAAQATTMAVAPPPSAPIPPPVAPLIAEVEKAAEVVVAAPDIKTEPEYKEVKTPPHKTPPKLEKKLPLKPAQEAKHAHKEPSKELHKPIKKGEAPKVTPPPKRPAPPKPQPKPKPPEPLAQATAPPINALQEQERGEKLAREKAVKEQAAQAKATQEKATREKAAQEKIVQERIAREQAAQEEAQRIQQQGLIAKAQESLAKMGASRDKIAKTNRSILGDATLPKQLENLQIDALPVGDGIVWTAKELSYRDEIARRLKRGLCLPDFGEVQVKLTLDKSGKVTEVQIVSSESPKNRQYVEKAIPALPFPPFGNELAGQPRCTFMIKLSNDL